MLSVGIDSSRIRLRLGMGQAFWSSAGGVDLFGVFAHTSVFKGSKEGGFTCCGVVSMG